MNKDLAASEEAALSWKKRAQKLEQDLERANAEVTSKRNENRALRNKVADLERRLSEESKYLEESYSLLTEAVSTASGLGAAYGYTADRYSALAGSEEAQETDGDLSSYAADVYAVGARKKRETLTHYLERFKAARAFADQRDLVKEANVYALSHVISEHRKEYSYLGMYQPSAFLVGDKTEYSPCRLDAVGEAAYKEAFDRAKKNSTVKEFGNAKNSKDAVLRYLSDEHDKFSSAVCQLHGR